MGIADKAGERKNLENVMQIEEWLGSRYKTWSIIICVICLKDRTKIRPGKGAQTECQ
jgi:hypothetical protein